MLRCNLIMVDEEGQTNAKFEARKRVLNIFNNSFLFSQGNEPIQGQMLYWLTKNGYLDPSVFEDEEMADAVGTMRIPQPHYKAKSRDINFMKVFKRVGKRVGNEKMQIDEGKNSVAELEQNIIEYMIESDLGFIANTGRPERKRSGVQEPDTRHDPFASWFRRFVINLEPTNNEGFDALMKQFNKRVNGDLRGTIEEDVSELARFWEQKHPGKSFYSEQ